ncbi:MAG: PLP-dependent aminotransferase family protein [Proteobacteria bacterium]|nr:PLP-dependent aminotransferase family protein [Pseudomonadota bacterium]
MTMWLPDLDGKSGPKYQSIALAIGESIASGSLKERDRLPPQRELAYQLGVSLNTVSRAYCEATNRGFLCGEVGRGTYVRVHGHLPSSNTGNGMMRTIDGPVDFTLNLPAHGNGAIALAETLETLKHSNALSSYLDYQTGNDLKRHTRAAASWISRLGFEASGDDIILTNGAQHAIMVALLAITRPGDVLLVEPMTYAPVKSIALHLGLILFAVEMDEGGLSPQALDAACSSTAAAVLYCLPTLHTPTTITMSSERRREIAEIARKHQLTIIEDDVFGFLQSHRPPPLAGFAPDLTILISSVSKCLAPGLRIGYIHAPKRLQRALRAAVNLSCWMPPPLMAEIASMWIEEGTADNLNEFQRIVARTRQKQAQQILDGHEVLSDPEGFHLWLLLPTHWRADTFRAAAEKSGVKVLTGETFAVEQNTAPQAVRLCLSHEISDERVNKGLGILAGLLAETSDPGLLVV